MIQLRRHPKEVGIISETYLGKYLVKWANKMYGESFLYPDDEYVDIAETGEDYIVFFQHNPQSKMRQIQLLGGSFVSKTQRGTKISCDNPIRIIEELYGSI